jgi:plastocyanin
MTVTGLPRWGVHVRPGDTLRINAAYDTGLQDTYEDMGIAVAYLAPDRSNGTVTAPGLDPFSAPLDPSANCGSGGLAKGFLCDKGVVTHGHLPEASNYGGPAAAGLATRKGPQLNQIQIAGFNYVGSDLSTVSMTGIPVVKLGQTLTFVNDDAAADVYHTITTCAFPCLGPTGVAFPIADGRTSVGRPLQLDSAELGYGPPFGPAKNAVQWSVAVTAADGYRPGEVVTYYCRIHPFMRGAFQVGA